MPSLSIKNVSEETLAQLRAQAKMHHRSLQGELLAILEGALNPSKIAADEASTSAKITIDELRRRVKKLGISTGDESTDWIRQLRDAR